MSQPVGKIRQPIDIDEFERRLRAPDDGVDENVDPLSALSRLVDGAEAPVAPVAHPHIAQSSVDWGAAVEQAPQPPRAANMSAPMAPAPAANDWEADLRSWEDELRGLASSGAVTPPQANLAPAVAPQVAAAAWEPPAHAPRVEPEMDSFDDYPPNAETVMAAEPHAEAAAYMARAAAVDYHSGSDPDAPRDLDEYPRSWRGEHDDEQSVEDEEYAEAPAKGLFSGRKPLIWVGAVATTLVVLVGGGFALRGGLIGKKDPPTILATSGPAKVQPEAASASNNATPGSGVFDKGADKVSASKLVSNEEQPVDVNAQARMPRVIGVNGDNAAKPVAPTAVAPAANNPNAFFPEPKRVKTVSVRPDGSVIEGDAPRAATVPTPPLRPAAAPAASVAPPSTATPKPAPPKTTARVVAPEATPDVALAAPKSKPVAPATKPAPAAAVAPAAGGGGFAVQFAATSNDSEARDRVGKVQAQYGAALAGRKPAVVRAESNGASVYRVRVGGLSKESAVAMCAKVKESGGSCFVAGN